VVLILNEFSGEARAMRKHAVMNWSSIRTAFTRLFAAWLVVLVFVPVTAPFQTYDMSDPLDAGLPRPVPVAPAPTAHKDAAVAVIPALVALRTFKMNVSPVCAWCRFDTTLAIDGIVAHAALGALPQVRSRIPTVLRQ
jgi:hypothetical protein